MVQHIAKIKRDLTRTANGRKLAVVLLLGLLLILATACSGGGAGDASHIDPATISTVVKVRVADDDDDAEERADGDILLDSSDLELTRDRDKQAVGMRFQGVNVPQASKITKAYVQLTVDETGSDKARLSVRAEASDDAAEFGENDHDITGRPTTNAAVAWEPAPWPERNRAGINQRTPDLSAVLQEVVNRPGWQSGNALVLIVTGEGERTAEAHDGESDEAPLLYLEYTTRQAPPAKDNRAPAVNAGENQTTTSKTVTLNGKASDDGLPDGELSTTWRKVSGPGAVRFGDPTALSTQATFPKLGEYVLRLTADDGEFASSDSLRVSVTSSDPGDPSRPHNLKCPGADVTLRDRSERYDNDSVGTDTDFAACGATITADKPVTLQNGADVTWTGGVLQGTLPGDSSWDEWHSSYGMYIKNVPNIVIEGLRVQGVGDGIRFRDNTPSWVLRDCYFKNTGDDAVENDSVYSGLVDDCLFDGTYVGFSARLSSSDEGRFDGSDNVWTVQNTLMWLRPQEGVYKGSSPGHGGFFKWDGDGYSPKLILRNNVFRVDQLPNHNTLSLNPQGNVIESENNVIVWLGEGEYPEPIPDGWTLTSDIKVWEEARADWLARHPDVAP